MKNLLFISLSCLTFTTTTTTEATTETTTYDKADLEMSTAKSAIMIRSQRAGSFLVIRTVQALWLTVNTRV